MSKRLVLPELQYLLCILNQVQHLLRDVEVDVILGVNDHASIDFPRVMLIVEFKQVFLLAEHQNGFLFEIHHQCHFQGLFAKEHQKLRTSHILRLAAPSRHLLVADDDDLEDLIKVNDLLRLFTKNGVQEVFTIRYHTLVEHRFRAHLDECTIDGVEAHEVVIRGSDHEDAGCLVLSDRVYMRRPGTRQELKVHPVPEIHLNMLAIQVDHIDLKTSFQVNSKHRFQTFHISAYDKFLNKRIQLWVQRLKKSFRNLNGKSRSLFLDHFGLRLRL